MTIWRRAVAIAREAAPVVIIGALLVVPLSLFVSARITRHLTRHTEYRLRREADFIAGQLSSVVSDTATGARSIEILRESGKRLGLHIVAFDAQGAIIAESGWPDDPPRAGEDLSAGYLSFRDTVFSGNRVAGTIRLDAPTEDLNRDIDSIRRVLTLAPVGLVILLAVIWVAINHRARRSLARLAETASRLSGGDWEARVPINPYRPTDEFSALAHAFNRMADEVESRYRQSRRERDQLETVLANMSDGVLAVDGHGRVRMVNQAFLKFIRSVYANPVGKPHTEAFRDRGLNELVERQLEGFADEGEELEVEWPKRRVLVVRTALIPGAVEDDVRGVLVARDVTVRRQIEQMRRDFVANVSHELRTPLTAIVGYASALREESLSAAERNEFLSGLSRNADRMNRIVGDLLELSRIESAGYRPQTAEFSLRELIGEVRSSLHTALEQSRHPVTMDISPDAETITADRDAVGRILLNLIDNTVKYTPEETAITISGRRDGDDLVLEVADDGPGVEEVHRPRLFERFYRVDRGRSREMGGTGLGLAIVKHLAEAHGGEARFEPNEPTGSRFVVRIPQTD